MCSADKPLCDFPTYRAGKYRRGYCYPCHLDKKRSHYAENKDTILAAQKQYAERNRETVNAKAARYRLSHKERAAEYARLYWAATKQEQEAKRKARYAANPELKQKKLERALEWQRQNPDKVNAKKHRRRARIEGAGGDYTTAEWAALKERYDNKCLKCNRQTPEIELTVDHVKPISKGGSNDISNIQPLCRSCNSEKHVDEIDYRVPLSL